MARRCVTPKTWQTRPTAGNHQAVRVADLRTAARQPAEGAGGRSPSRIRRRATGRRSRSRSWARSATGPRAVQINLSVYTPAGASKPVPVILLANFGGGNAPAPAAPAGGSTAPAVPTGEPPVADDILERGWGYATLRYQDIQPDRANTLTEGVIGLTLRAGSDAAGPGRVGRGHRLGLGHQPRHRLPCLRQIDRRQADRPAGPLAARKDGALGLGD